MRPWWYRPGVRPGVGGADALADLDRIQQRRVKEDVACVVKGGLVLPRSVDGDREQAFLDPVDDDLLRDGRATTDGNRGFAPEDIGHRDRIALLQLLLVDPVVAQQRLGGLGNDAKRAQEHRVGAQRQGPRPVGPVMLSPRIVMSEQLDDLQGQAVWRAVLFPRQLIDKRVKSRKPGARAALTNAPGGLAGPINPVPWPRPCRSSPGCRARTPADRGNAPCPGRWC